MSAKSGAVPRINPLLTHASCSLSGTRHEIRDRKRPLGLCNCCPSPGSPLLLQYDVPAICQRIQRGGVFDDSADGLFRYGALLPVARPDPAFACDVGRTPCYHHARLSGHYGVELWFKDEHHNPTGSFKDRGLCLGVALGVAFGARQFALPTQGNAGVAAALFCSRLDLAPCIVAMPDGYQGSVYHRAAAHFNAQVLFAGANIAATGRHLRSRIAPQLASGEVVDLSTFFEPGRLEGKKTMGYEIFESMAQRGMPDYIVYPTGGGTGLVGIWKAFDELTQLGLLQADRLPKMIAVQSAQCAPVVFAFERQLDAVAPVISQGTVADGLDVPAAIMGHGILSTLRNSAGTAIAVSEAEIHTEFSRLALHGISAGYESAAVVAGLARLVSGGAIRSNSRVLVLNTSGHSAALARTSSQPAN